MKIEIEDLSSVKKKIAVEVPEKEVFKGFDNAYKNLQSKASIKGFRKGKTPKKVLKNLYGDKVKGEVAEGLVTSSLTRVIKENEYIPVAMPSIDPGEIEEGKAFSYSATVEIRPSLEVKGYREVAVKKKEVVVSDEEVESGLKDLSEKHPHYQDVEDDSPVKDGDMLTIDSEGFVDGKPMKDGQAKDMSIDLGSGRLIPKFEEQLVGMKKGEEKEVRVTYPDNYPNKLLANQEGVFKVTLKGIKAKSIPAIDDEFAKDLQCEDLNDLKGKIREDAKRQKESIEEAGWRDEVVMELIGKDDFEVPGSVVDGHLNRMIEDGMNKLKQQGLPEEQMPSYEQLKSEYFEKAETEVKRGYIVEAIAKQEALKISNAEYDKKIREISASGESDVETVRTYMEDKGLADDLKLNMLEEKVFELIGESLAVKSGAAK